ncbi:MAG: molybdopterin converting factor subunit 1 [Bauldia sp.]
MKLLYFAWVRERIGRREEDLDPPRNVNTVGELVAWLRSRGPEYENALSEPDVIRVAVDRLHAAPATPIAGAREIALFPPMTGG